MNAVDVLAVMDDALGVANQRLDAVVLDDQPGNESVRKAKVDAIFAARSAVAELIEAGVALQEAMDEPDNRPFDVGPAKRFHEADARFRAALARCKGGAA